MRQETIIMQHDPIGREDAGIQRKKLEGRGFKLVKTTAKANYSILTLEQPRECIVIVERNCIKSIEAAEQRKDLLENAGYNLLNTLSGLNKATLAYQKF